MRMGACAPEIDIKDGTVQNLGGLKNYPVACGSPGASQTIPRGCGWGDATPDPTQMCQANKQTPEKTSAYGGLCVCVSHLIRRPTTTTEKRSRDGDSSVKKQGQNHEGDKKIRKFKNFGTARGDAAGGGQKLTLFFSASAPKTRNLKNS